MSFTVFNKTATLPCALLPLALVFAVVFAIGAPALTWADEAQILKSGPCSAIISQYCTEPDLTTTEIYKCLESHRAQLSRACSRDLAPLALDVEKVPEKCRADVKEACPNVVPGDGRVMACLKAKQASLSPSCHILLEEAAVKKP
jgi:hypothetical protein